MSVSIPNTLVPGKYSRNPHNKHFNLTAIGVQESREAMVKIEISKNFGSDIVSS